MRHTRAAPGEGDVCTINFPVILHSAGGGGRQGAEAAPHCHVDWGGALPHGNDTVTALPEQSSAAEILCALSSPTEGTVHSQFHYGGPWVPVFTFEREVAFSGFVKVTVVSQSLMSSFTDGAF